MARGWIRGFAAVALLAATCDRGTLVPEPVACDAGACAGAFVCEDDLCLPLPGGVCGADLPCAGGLECVDGVCAPECGASDPCPDGGVCRDGACFAGPGGSCDASTPCAPGSTCVDGGCVVDPGGACVGDEPCAGGYSCQGLACSGDLGSPCDAEIPCVRGAECEDGECRGGLDEVCGPDAPCLGALTCDDGVCRGDVGAPCAGAGDCAGALVCRDDVCVDGDRCAVDHGGCDPDADCETVDDAPVCTCRDGFDGDGVTCEDVDECAPPAAPCDPNAACTNEPGGYSCDCDDGWSGDGATCADVDECASDLDACPVGADCVDLDGSYTCDCGDGYGFDGTGCVNVDECAQDPGPCDPNADCQDGDGDFTCDCRDGFDGDGLVCDDVNECEAVPPVCAASEACVNEVGDFRCECAPGYVPDGDDCVNVDECLVDNGGCAPEEDCTDTPGSRVCSCKDGYEGQAGSCLDIDECLLVRCIAGEVCVNLPGSFECRCADGYVEDGGGVCVPVTATIGGGFGANRLHVAPSSPVTSQAITVSDVTVPLTVNLVTSGVGEPATFEVFRDGSWTTASDVRAGDQLRVILPTSSSLATARSVTVTLTSGPTTVWTSPAWSATTWFYTTGSATSYGACSVSCGGGTQNPTAWTCDRSDGTGGHTQSFCSPPGARSCNTQACPFPTSGQVYPNGNIVTINDPNSNNPRYDIQCRNGGNGNTSSYTIVSPAGVSVSTATREITIFLQNSSTSRAGYVRFTFNATQDGLSVSSFVPGAGQYHPYLCFAPATSTPACQAWNGDPANPNCSSYMFCRMRDRNQGSQNTVWSNSLSGGRALACPAVPDANLPPPAWLSW
jgi:hypothetical protein